MCPGGVHCMPCTWSTESPPDLFPVELPYWCLPRYSLLTAGGHRWRSTYPGTHVVYPPSSGTRRANIEPMLPPFLSPNLHTFLSIDLIDSFRTSKSPCFPVPTSFSLLFSFPHPPPTRSFATPQRKKLRFYLSCFGARSLSHTHSLSSCSSYQSTKQHTKIHILFELSTLIPSTTVSKKWKEKQAFLSPKVNTRIKTAETNHNTRNGPPYLPPPPRSYRCFCPPFRPRPLPQQAASGRGP